MYLRGFQFSMLLIDVMLQKWHEMIGQARQSVDFLKDQDVIRAVLNILQVFMYYSLHPPRVCNIFGGTCFNKNFSRYFLVEESHIRGK